MYNSNYSNDTSIFGSQYKRTITRSHIRYWHVRYKPVKDVQCVKTYDIKAQNILTVTFLPVDKEDENTIFILTLAVHKRTKYGRMHIDN